MLVFVDGLCKDRLTNENNLVTDYENTSEFCYNFSKTIK